jgi:hypothetical protein
MQLQISRKTSDLKFIFQFWRHPDKRL